MENSESEPPFKLTLPSQEIFETSPFEDELKRHQSSITQPNSAFVVKLYLGIFLLGLGIVLCIEYLSPKFWQHFFLTSSFELDDAMGFFVFYAIKIGFLGLLLKMATTRLIMTPLHRVLRLG